MMNPYERLKGWVSRITHSNQPGEPQSSSDAEYDASFVTKAWQIKSKQDHINHRIETRAQLDAFNERIRQSVEQQHNK